MDLNDLVLRLVLDWLPLVDVVRCGQVCRRWRAVAKNPVFWRNKRLWLREINDCLTVLAFAPCLGELRVGIWGPDNLQHNVIEFSDGDELVYLTERLVSYKFCSQLVDVINNSGIEITKLELTSVEQSEDPVSYLLRAVMAHIVELDVDSFIDIYRDDVVRMPKLRVLKISPPSGPSCDERDQVSPRLGFTGSLEILEMPCLKAAFRFDLIHENASTIQELRLSDVSWDQLDVILKLKRLRLLQVARITGDLPSPLPTPECHIDSLKLASWLPWFDFNVDVSVTTITMNEDALLAVLSGSVSELTLYSFNNTLFTRLAAMPKLRRLHLQSGEWGKFPCGPVTISPIPSVEYVKFSYLASNDSTKVAAILGTFAATLQEARLEYFNTIQTVKLAKLPAPGHGRSVDRPPGSLQIDFISLPSSVLAASLPLLPLIAATLRKISIFFPVFRFDLFEFSVLSSFMSYIMQHNSGELQQVEIMYDPVMAEEARKKLHFHLQAVGQLVPNLTIRPYSEKKYRRFGYFK